MNDDGATVTFESHVIQVYLFEGRSWVIAQDLGRALEYRKDGKDFVDSISGWPDVNAHATVLRGERLRQFKRIVSDTAGVAVSDRVARITLLDETGVDLACQRAHTPAGDRIRLSHTDVMAKLRRHGRHGEIGCRLAESSTSSGERCGRR
jgi:hypothetical protein